MPKRQHNIEAYITARDDASPVIKSFSQTLSDAAGVTVGMLGARLFEQLGSAISGMARAAISAGADWVETMGKFEQTFKGAADGMSASLDDFAARTGRSRVELHGMSADMGAVLKAMHFGEEAAADMASQITQLAVDVGSFYNVAAPDALHAMEAAVAGNTQSLRRFGVVINEEMIKQEAYTSGLVKSGEAIDQQSKAIAVMNLMLAAKADALGDAERTSESWANQTVKANAIVKDFTTAVGVSLTEALGPLQRELIGLAGDALPRLAEMLSGSVIPAIADFAHIAVDAFQQVVFHAQTVFNFFQENEHAVVGALTAMAVAAAVFTKTAVAGFLAVAGTAAVALAPFVALGAAVALLAKAWTEDWGGIATTLTAFWNDSIKPVLEMIHDWLRVHVPAAIAFLSALWQEALWPAIEAVVGLMQEHLLPILERIAEFLGGVILQATELMADMWQTIFLPALQAVANFLIETFLPALERVFAWLGIDLPAAIESATLAFDTTKTAMEETIAVEQALANANMELTHTLEAMGLTVEDFGVAVTEGVESAAEGFVFTLEAMGLSVEDFGVQVNDAAEGLRVAYAAMGEAILDSGYLDALHEANQLAQEIMEDMATGMQGIQEAHLAKMEEAEFQHQLKAAQAQQMYQEQRRMLQEAGKAKEVADLDAKFREQESLAEHSYSIQQQLAERALLQQEHAQLESYVQQLEMQQQAIHDTLMLKVMESEEFQALSADQQYKAMLQLDEGIAARLKLEKEAGEAAVNIAAAASEGKMDILAAELEAYKQAAANNIDEALSAAKGARDAAGQRVKDFKIEMPPIDLASFRRSLDPSAIAKPAKAASERAAKEATEPATRALADVAKQIDQGVEAALNAIKNLAEFEVPEGVAEGMERFAEFLQMAVATLYDVFTRYDLKTKIDAFVDSLEPLMGIMGLVSMSLQSIGQMQELSKGEFPDLAAWGDRLAAMIIHMVSVLQFVREKVGDEALESAASIVEHVSAISSLFGVGGLGAMQELAGGEFVDLEEWGNRLAMMIIRVKDVLQFVSDTVSNNALDAAASLVGDITQIASLFSVGGLDAMKALADGEFVDLTEWGNRLAMMIMRTKDVLQFVADTVGEEALDAATEIISQVTQIANLFSIGGLAAMKDLSSGEFVDLEEWGNRLAMMILRTKDVLQFVRDKVGKDALDAAAEMTGSIGKLLSLVGVDGVKAMKELVDTKFPDMFEWGNRLAMMIMKVIGVLEFVEKELGKDAIEAAAGISDDLKKVAGILGIDAIKAVQTLVNAEWPDLTAWGARLYAMFVAAKDVLEDVYDRVGPDLLEAVAGIASDFTEVMSILTIGMGVERAGPNFLARVVKHLENLELAAPLVQAALQKIKGEWDSLDQMAEDAEIAETLNKVFRILDLGEMFAGLEIQKGLGKDESRLPLMQVIDRILMQMKEAAPKLRDELRAVADIFGDALEDSVIIAERLAAVFQALQKVVETGASMAGEEGWRLESVKRMIGEIAEASAAVSTIPEPTFGPPVAAGGVGNGESGMSHELRLVIEHREPSGEFTEHVINVTLNRVDEYLGEFVI